MNRIAEGGDRRMSIKKLPFLEVFKDVTGGNKKTPQSEFLVAGDIPVVDQGQQLVAGFINDRSRICNVNLPIIVFGDHTRTIKFVDFEFAMGADGTKILASKMESDMKYLFYALGAVNIPSAGYSRHFKFLKETMIPLPSIEEQKRIAAILDAADALRAKRRESIVQLDALLQSTFLDMFGDPVTNPMRWEVVSMQSIAGKSLRNGISASTTGSIQGQVLTLSAITSSKYDGACCKHVNFDRIPQINQLVTEDTFLICRGNGNKKMVGIGAFPRNCRGRVVFPDTIIASRPDLSRIERAYLQFVRASRKVREQIESGARTTNGTYKINQAMLNSVTFPLPPSPSNAASPPSSRRPNARRHVCARTWTSWTRSSVPSSRAPSTGSCDRP